MKNKILYTLTCLAMLCTGCSLDYMPDLTDEQVQEIGEYVAITMMKYDANNRSRLVELDESEVDSLLAPTPAPTEVPKEPTGMEPVEDTPEIDVAGGETAPEPTTMEEVLVFPDGLSLTVDGYEVCDSYPSGNENPYFALYAADGKKLLTVKLQLKNSSNEEQVIDMLSTDEIFTLKVNEDYTRRALTTMLDNDLTTYIGVVPAGESVGVVLIIEVDEAMAGSISGIELNVENEEKEYAINVL